MKRCGMFLCHLGLVVALALTAASAEAQICPDQFKGPFKGSFSGPDRFVPVPVGQKTFYFDRATRFVLLDNVRVGWLNEQGKLFRVEASGAIGGPIEAGGAALAANPPAPAPLPGAVVPGGARPAGGPLNVAGGNGIGAVGRGAALPGNPVAGSAGTLVGNALPAGIPANLAASRNNGASVPPNGGGAVAGNPIGAGAGALAGNAAAANNNSNNRAASPVAAAVAGTPARVAVQPAVARSEASASESDRPAVPFAPSAFTAPSEPNEAMLGVWRNESKDPLGRVTVFEMDLESDGKATVLFHIQGQEPSEFKRTFSFADNVLTLNDGGAQQVLGRLVTAEKDRLVLQQADGTRTFIRPSGSPDPATVARAN